MQLTFGEKTVPPHHNTTAIICVCTLEIIKKKKIKKTIVRLKSSTHLKPENMSDMSECKQKSSNR